MSDENQNKRAAEKAKGVEEKLEDKKEEKTENINQTKQDIQDTLS